MESIPTSENLSMDACSIPQVDSFYCSVCKVNGTAKYVNAHVKMFHLKFIKCEFCSSKITLYQFENHISQCMCNFKDNEINK